MRLLAAALLLSACSSHASSGYHLVIDGSDGAISLHKFGTIEACEEAKRRSDPTVNLRCTTGSELRR
jgi:hypothetical protein